MLSVATLVALAAGQVAVARAGTTLTVEVGPREATTVNIEPRGTGLVLTVTAVRPTRMPPSKGIQTGASREAAHSSPSAGP